MSDVEQQAKSFIQDLFIQRLRDRYKKEKSLSLSNELTFDHLTVFNIAEDNISECKSLFSQCCKEYIEHCSIADFEKIFNVFMNTDKVFRNLVEKYFGADEKMIMEETIQGTTRAFTRIAASVFDHPSKAGLYLSQIENAPGFERIRHALGRPTTSKLCIAYLIHDLTQSYLYGILDKGLRTDYHSYSQFMQDIQLLTDRVIEVLYSLDNTQN